MLHSREDLFQFLAPQNCSISSLFCLSFLSVQQEGWTFFQVHLLGDLSWLFPVVKARALWLCWWIHSCLTAMLSSLTFKCLTASLMSIRGNALRLDSQRKRNCLKGMLEEKNRAGLLQLLQKIFSPVVEREGSLAEWVVRSTWYQQYFSTAWEVLCPFFFFPPASYYGKVR